MAMKPGQGGPVPDLKKLFGAPKREVCGSPSMLANRGGPEGVWDAIELLKAERIDHGVRAIEDAKLVKILSERQIPLGICPTSNLIGKLYPELKEHPLEKLRRAGIPVSVNTDDPGPLGLTLAGEYEKCAAAFEWSEPDLHAVAKTSIEASFADVATKERLLGELDRWQISR
jgi:adenosine deaminase